MHTWWWWYYCMCGLLLIGRCLGSVVGMGWKKEGSNRTTDDKLWVQGPLETVWVRGNCPLKLWSSKDFVCHFCHWPNQHFSATLWMTLLRKKDGAFAYGLTSFLVGQHFVHFFAAFQHVAAEMQTADQSCFMTNWNCMQRCRKWDHFCELSLFPSFAPEMQTSCTHLRFNCVLKMWKKTIDEGSTSQQTDTRKTLKAIKMFCTLKHASWCMRFGDIIT